MGFWNSVIYIVTSWRAVSDLFAGKLCKPNLRRRSRSSAKEDNRHVLGMRRKGSGSDSAKGLAFDKYDRV